MVGDGNHRAWGGAVALGYIFKSLAVVIICGLSFTTVLTLIFVPTLYAMFFGVKAEETGEPQRPKSL